LAADVANATAESFVREQIETKAAQARQGGEWLEQRMGEMRDKMNTATQIAQEFRSRHDYSVRPPGASLINGQIVFDDDAETANEPTLEELEVTADTYREMYESFLLAFTNNLSQQSYPVADARVITAATRPLQPSYPRKKLVLAFGMFAGLVAGVGQAFIRNAIDQTIRSPRQIQEKIGQKCLAALPPLGTWRGGTWLPDEVAVSPQSRFSESLRRARFAIVREGALDPVRLIGVSSAVPDEGKCTIASNLAVLYAMSGRRTLLVDADTDYSLLTRRLIDARAQGERASGAEILTGVLRDVDFLPSSALKGMPPTSLTNFDAYDVVVVDLPPLAAGFERLSVCSGLDGVLLVTEWGRSTVEGTRELASAIQAHNASVFGVILTRVKFLSTKPYRSNYRLHR
jgi:Mrp family chromosome partitioning ATPase